MLLKPSSACANTSTPRLLISPGPRRLLPGGTRLADAYIILVKAAALIVLALLLGRAARLQLERLPGGVPVNMSSNESESDVFLLGRGRLRRLARARRVAFLQWGEERAALSASHLAAVHVGAPKSRPRSAPLGSASA